ncbi:zinc finger protein 208 [Elysia marginata]|uniref:Zinc finger protein 208 n=1 Tax=Elysia marginata TaxID=1093978 RepID=A0AAV4H7N5_9GAST|nr:zinc finger protein 208 [Elysia marginata]
MAGVEVGPNDIVIHLVNPYRCGDCGDEFFLRTAFLEHVAGHIASLKAEKPCHQIVCVTKSMEHAPKGITVTRDILQINDQQLFELQDFSVDVSQLSPIKALEQAGILKLPETKQTQTTVPLLVPPDVGVFEGGRGGKRQVSLLKQQQQQLKAKLLGQEAVPSRFKELSSELEKNDELVTITEGPDGEMQYVSSDLSDPKVINAIMQQAMLDVEHTIKIEDGNNSINVQEPMIVDGDHLMIEVKGEGKKDQDNFISENILEAHHESNFSSCSTCPKTLNNASTLKKHWPSHQRQHTCPVCHKGYDRLAQLVFHMKQHDRKRFIQFGSNFHEVRIISSRNQKGQMVQEHYLLLLLSKEELGQLGAERDSALKTQSFSELNDSKIITEPGKSEDENTLPKNEESSKADTCEQQSKGHKAYTAVQKPGPELLEGALENKVFKMESRNVEGDDMNKDADISFSNKDQSATITSVSSVYPKKYLYKCGHCKKVFFTRPVMSRHLIKHTNTKPFQCEKCLKSFRDKTDLFHHYRTHTKPVQCSTCHTTFSKSLYLRNHLNKGCPSHPSDDRIVALEDARCLCKVCDKVLKNKANAIRHMRIHDFQERARLRRKKDSYNLETVTGISQNVEDHFKPLGNSVGFQCLLCGEELRFKSFMMTHVRKHLNQRLFKCDLCPKSFFARHVLRKHQQNHTRPYKCPVCDKGFMRRYMMTKHFKKRHDLPEGVEDPMKDITELPDQKLIQCDICGKTMKQCHKSLMLYHIRLHKDVRPFKCDKCPKSFISENALKKHSLTHSKPYVCQVCGMSFSRRYLLTDHFKKTCIFKVGKLKADAVKATTVQNQSSLSISKSIQSNLEEEGQEKEGTKETVNEEKRKHSGSTGDSYFCEPCGKHFTVYETFLRHMNTFSKPTACKYCKQMFESKHVAIAHQRSCLGPAIAERTNTHPKKGISVADEGWQERLKIMEQVDRTIQTVVGVDGDRSLTQPTEYNNGTEKYEGNQTETTALSRTVEALKNKQGKYGCPQCDRVFSTPRGLKIHASVHVRLFKCEICDVEFKSIKALRSHHTEAHDKGKDSGNGISKTTEISVAEEINSTEICDQSYSMLATQTDCVGGTVKKELDLEEDNLPSNQSEASFALLSLANISASENGDQRVVFDDAGTGVESPHKQTKGSNQNKNDQTLKDSQPEVEVKLMQLGTRGRPYRCQLCRKRFTEQNNLDAHMVLAH